MPDHDKLLQTLAGFASTLTQGYEISDVLHDLAERVTDVLAITGAGVSLLDDGHLRFVTSDRETLANLERIQEIHQAGPCVEAIGTGEPVVVHQVADYAERWPAYINRAGALGIGAIAAIPMRAAKTSIGTLDLYHDQAHDWSQDDLTAARTLADIATSYVVNASRYEQQRRIAEQLQQALNSRIVIEQAKGIIAAHRATNVDNAYSILRKHTRDHGASLHDIARAVVDLGLRP